MTVSDFFQVDESMENVEYVVRERNRAYFELETGVSGEAERRIQTGPFGLPVGYTPKEHAVPWKLNAEYRKFLRYRYQVWSLTQLYSVWLPFKSPLALYVVSVTADELKILSSVLS